MEYLNDQYNLDLLPKDPYERAKGKLVIDIINKKIIPAYFRTIQAQDPDKQAAGTEEFTAALKEFAERLPKNDGPFYGGKKFGFVDIELVPWVLRYIIETLWLMGEILHLGQTSWVQASNRGRGVEEIQGMGRCGQET